MGRTPNVAAGDRATVEQLLDYVRSEVDSLISEVSDADASRRLLPSTDLTIGGLVRHLAWVEDYWFQHQFLGSVLPEPWASAPFDDDPDWEFHSAIGESAASTRALYAEACERSRAVVRSAESLDITSARPSHGRGNSTLRWILVHMIEETARHAGHLDLLLDATH